MRKLWVVLAACACGGSSQPAMGPPPAPATVAATERAEPVERAAPAAAATPQVASDPEEGGQIASDPEEGGEIAAAAGPGAGTARAGVSPGVPSVSGDIDREAFKKVVRRHFDEIRACYERALQKNPALDGRVVVVFTIGKDGKVTGAKATGVDDDLDRCIEARFEAWDFGKQPEPVQISYPFMFTRQ
jgi:outer membrane biosynthesis protein TonB